MCKTLNLYNELKGWQGAIGSLLGFLALMIAALWNFHLNRRRDASLRKEEALSIAAALYGEIILLRKETARLARAAAQVHVNVGTSRDPIVKFDAHFVAEHTLSEPTLYKALASKIGLLSADLILAITEFHENFQQARTWLPLLIHDADRQYDNSVSYVLRPARDAVQDIVPALRKIEQLAFIKNPAGALDLGRTEDVLEMENELSSTPSSPE